MIKINHITNLHDARFSAAENVDFITFALGKGNLKKIALTTYQDIISWISGSYLVVDFEKDWSSLMDFLDKSIPFDFLQIHDSILQHVPKEYYEKLIIFTENKNFIADYLSQGFIIESKFEVEDEKHFQLINKNIPKQRNRNYSLDNSFFLDSYELDYELFNDWNKIF